MLKWQTVKKWYIFLRNTQIVLFAGPTFWRRVPNIISEDERERKRERCAIAPVAHRVKSPHKERAASDDDVGGRNTGKPNGRMGTRRREGGNKRTRSPLHCVTKRATRPAKSMSTLMRVPRCVKIPRRRNNIGRARCSAIPFPSASWTNCCWLFFFIYFRYFPLFATGNSSAVLEYIFLRDTCDRDWSGNVIGFVQDLKERERKVLPLR